VLFPIPGSPPSKMMEPGTAPPPRTRSSSGTPSGRRGARSALAARSGCGCAGAAAVRPPAARARTDGLSRTVSTSEFQEPQLRQGFSRAGASKAQV
jgi:hypothetical protein